VCRRGQFAGVFDVVFVVGVRFCRDGGVVFGGEQKAMWFFVFAGRDEGVVVFDGLDGLSLGLTFCSW
jgi:hypothetical protein